MTVAELKAELAKYPEDMEVMYRQKCKRGNDDEYGLDDPEYDVWHFPIQLDTDILRGFDGRIRKEIVSIDKTFGSHNLTAQAEWNPNKNFSQNSQNWENPTENVISDSKIQSESAESVETSTKEDAYFAYRLELAKELAVAVIRSVRWDFNSCDPVRIANDIVKRLKETEE